MGHACNKVCISFKIFEQDNYTKTLGSEEGKDYETERKGRDKGTVDATSEKLSVPQGEEDRGLP